VSTFVLVPGAGGNASYWRELVAELGERGHETIAVDIPQDDPAVGLPEYADLVVAAIGERRDTVVVAQSLGGFTAPMVADRHAVRMIVLLNAMIPLPGETPGQWWGATGSDPARRAAEEAAGRDPEFDEERTFFHDLPDDVRAQMERDPQPRAPADTIWNQPCDIQRWPDVTTHVVVGRDDRLFPQAFQQRVARERLGVEPDVLPGGHLLAKSRSVELADQLEEYVGHR
jgi:pimeloyl-ACP methyl ester carboxylesterase